MSLDQCQGELGGSKPGTTYILHATSQRVWSFYDNKDIFYCMMSDFLFSNKTAFYVRYLYTQFVYSDHLDYFRQESML